MLPVTNSSCDVLVVEDDATQCEEMAEYLARAGLTIKMAHNGKSALYTAAALRPRVALVDYNLPDCIGLKLAEGIRRLLPETAIIMMSGRIEGLPEKKLEELGITVFVNKPLPLNALRQAVLRLAKAAPVDQIGAHRRKGWLATGLGGTN